MAIVALQRVRIANGGTIEEQIGRALCLRSMLHFVQVLGQPGLGMSYQSCNAAVAVVEHPQYDVVGLGEHRFSLVYGSSRLYTGLDPAFNAIHPVEPRRPFSRSVFGEHAEQSAIRVADAQALRFWNHGGHNHLYVDLIPCADCTAWLVAHPSSWYVHYYSELNNQAPVIAEKKRRRSDTFGRIMEQRPSKRPRHE